MRLATGLNRRRSAGALSLLMILGLVLLACARTHDAAAIADGHAGSGCASACCCTVPSDQPFPAAPFAPVSALPALALLAALGFEIAALSRHSGTVEPRSRGGPEVLQVFIA